jgi:hippurate hydrolase
VINTAEPVANAVAAARSAVGTADVVTDFAASLGCEDFATMVRAAGGAYAWIGAGDAGPGEGLHGDRYDFNDAIVPVVLNYWVNLVRQVLGPAT